MSDYPPVRSFDEAAAQVGEYFMGRSPVHQAAEAIARILTEEGVDFAIAGALALNEHGVLRATEDVDILITRDGLARFKEKWLGRGYVELRAGGRSIRDAAHQVRIDFLISGDFPGDGKPKPVAFPEPRAAAVTGDRFPVLALERFVELKLASGMTAPHRLQDLADVVRLVRARTLPSGFVDSLDPWVREKYAELWRAAQAPEDDY
jgi:hypothetical protein